VDQTFNETTNILHDEKELALCQHEGASVRRVQENAPLGNFET